jgi:hypothetical protein
MSQLAVPRFEVRITGVRKALRKAQGLDGAGEREAAGVPPDCVVVPAIGFKMPDPLEQALARPDIADAGAALRQWGAAAARR